jgi:hypothetical protein
MRKSITHPTGSDTHYIASPNSPFSFSIEIITSFEVIFMAIARSAQIESLQNPEVSEVRIWRIYRIEERRIIAPRPRTQVAGWISSSLSRTRAVVLGTLIAEITSEFRMMSH